MVVVVVVVGGGGGDVLFEYTVFSCRWFAL